MFEDLGHKHKWAYMFSAGNANAFQWYFCTDCLAQAVGTLDTGTGKVSIEVFGIKPKDKRR